MRRLDVIGILVVIVIVIVVVGLDSFFGFH